MVTELEQVGQFCYLGSMITTDAKCHVEIKRRIAMGKDAFYKRKELMRGKLNKNLKKRIIKSMIWSVVLYGSDIHDSKEGRHQKIGGLRDVDMAKKRESQLDGSEDK